MSIFNALVNAVTGMRAQSFALNNISSNIANSQTTGYKRVDTGFQDLVGAAPLRQQNGGSVAAFSRSTNTIAGTLTETRVPTHFGIDGEGFVAVRERVESNAGVPSFSATNLYSRRGDFTLDRNGYLVNGAGHYLVGNTLDPATGAKTGSVPDVVRVAAGRMPAQPTTTVSFSGNLPATPRTEAYEANVPGSDIWAAPGGTLPAAVTPATVPDSAAFARNSIAGPSVTMYDATGNPVDVNMRWTKAAETAAGSTWGLYAATGPAATSAASSWTLASAFTFNASGRMTAPAGPFAMNLTGLGLGAAVNFELAGQVTQYADIDGQAKVDRVTQDGGAMGDFESLSISDDGLVMARYTNGRTQGLAQIAIAQFNAPEALQRTGGGAFQATVESGDPLWNANGATLRSGALEGSNTDIAEEFSKMIVTQQAYSANTRVISTSQQMLQETLNVVR
ncbi:MAG: flagellar hook protein FlgE [Alsobacter sp.]